jgi:hypothetical protein
MEWSTGFGWVELDGHRYEHDIVVHTDGSVSKRRKKRSKGLRDDYGHTPLSHHELDILEEERPRRVIIGIGQNGALPITPKAKRLLEGYDHLIALTPAALRALGEEGRGTLAIIHVTC